jgi:putative nucleotidyltransferase with HDIG domain
LNKSKTPASSSGTMYLVCVVVAGLVIIAHSLVAMYASPPRLEWFILATLTLLTGSFTIRVPTLAARISVSETFVFTSVLLFGPSAGTATVILDSLIASFWLRSSTRSIPKILFNAAAPAIAIWSSSQIFFLIVQTEPGSIHSRNLGQLIGPVFTFALLYFLINTSLVAGAIATERDASPARIWVDNFPPLSITYFVGASIAILIVAYTPQIDFSVLSIILPLLVISYVTFKSSMGRLEDAERHVAQVNELYVSAIETLAMAVDAKDQITHGHIRRVQVYATELAKRLGVEDHQQLKAIEAAALLHDMGKLAIPEHILNKPGKLTSSEFEKMKRHADIGADLLSSIPFPYPVVPIVRHHHENWDGTGYPNRIAGTDIPLGARILSVVDCFDALTSDRPYRPRLSDAAAFEILNERRGTMYDPLVVDAFIQSHGDIAPAAIAAGQQARSLLPTSAEPNGHHSSRALGLIRAESSESSALLEARKWASKAHSVGDALGVVGVVIRQFTPATVIALYEHNTQLGTERCTQSVGDTAGLLNQFDIPYGERITGWVAANNTAIVNSSAVLDLGHIAESFQPPLKATLSTPVLVNHNSVAVLTLYSTLDAPFTERHEYVASEAASILAEHVDVGARRPTSLVSFADASRSAHVRK